MAQIFMRLAPNQWVHSTRDGSIRLRRCFVPFWNISFQGSIECALSTKSNTPFRHEDNYYSQKRWHTFPLKLDRIGLNNVNIYAAESFDKYHIQKLDVSFDDVELVDLNDEHRSIEQSTVDQTVAFDHAWIMIIKPLLENMCIEEAKKIYPKFEEARIDSFHLTITSKQERLLYYPIYMIGYKYKSDIYFTCLFDGLTGHIAGDRQYSALKVTFAALIGFYPMIKLGLFSFGTLANLLFAFEVASDLSLTASLPIAAIVAPCIGLYARSYPKLYKKELSQAQWTDEKAKISKFTYDIQKQLEP